MTKCLLYALPLFGAKMFTCRKLIPSFTDDDTLMGFSRVAGCVRYCCMDSTWCHYSAAKLDPMWLGSWDTWNSIFFWVRSGLTLVFSFQFLLQALRQAHHKTKQITINHKSTSQIEQWNSSLCTECEHHTVWGNQSHFMVRVISTGNPGLWDGCYTV